MTKERFLEDINKLCPDKIIVFIGSGYVKELGYPTWYEFINSGVEFVKGYTPEVSAVMASRISRNELIAAGKSLFEPEIPHSDLFTFFRKNFDKNPDIPQTIYRIFTCPFAAFVTTNFDRSIEQALTKCHKTTEVYAEKSRFRNFASRISVYAESIEQRKKNGLVLKMHGDIGCPEEMVLSQDQFNLLRADISYEFLYKHLLSQYTIIFIGFSGCDPNFIWHCNTIHDVCGVPLRTSYFLHSDNDASPKEIEKANIVAVPYSASNSHEELKDILTSITSHFSVSELSKAIPEIVPIDDAKKETLAFICAGLNRSTHTSTYHCAIVSMVAEATSSIGRIEDETRIVQAISRMYHISISDAGKIFSQADRSSVVRAIEQMGESKSRFERFLRILRDGISKRARAFGKPFQKSDRFLDGVVLSVLVGAFSKTGTGLALSLVDSEAPEASLIDKILRRTVDQLKLPGLGDLDKEVLKSTFADIFTRPNKEEGMALTSIAQAAVASSLAITFSGGLEKILDLMPREAYLDANVAIPLVIRDHPRSTHYHEFIVGLSKIHCDTYLLDVFLDEMVHHCALAYDELKEAKINSRDEVREYAEFHSPLRINAFISAYASGAKQKEKFSNYLGRIFGAVHPSQKDFKRAIEKLGIEVVPTDKFDKSPSVELAIHIASEKSKLMRIRAQILAQHEAVQVLWIHKVKINKPVWFITEDATLRKILRALPSVSFSTDPPSRGVMPAYGAHLLVASLYERPNLDGTFAQLLWNPSYLEQVDTMLSSVLRKFSTDIKELRKMDLLELRDKTARIMQKEMDRTEKDSIKIRAREFNLGQPQIVTSIIRELGNEQ